MTTLVSYATAKGSTRGVAERIAAQLESLGETVDAQSLHAVASVQEYDTLVVGSAIHSGQWLPEAVDAIARLRPQLTGRSVWAYSVSSVGVTSTILSDRVAPCLRRVTPEPRVVQLLRETADFRGHRSFAGAIGPGDWSGLGRVLFRLMGGHYGDARDWTDIDQWAKTIHQRGAQVRGD